MPGVEVYSTVYRRGNVTLVITVYSGNGAEDLSTMPSLRDARLKAGEEVLIAVLAPGHPEARDEVFALLFPGVSGWLGHEPRPH